MIWQLRHPAGKVHWKITVFKYAKVTVQFQIETLTDFDPRIRTSFFDQLKEHLRTIVVGSHGALLQARRKDDGVTGSTFGLVKAP